MAAHPALERAFVAMSYWLGDRGASLEGWDFGAEARTLARALSNESRDARATLLAREVARIAVLLDKGAIG